MKNDDNFDGNFHGRDDDLAGDELIEYYKSLEEQSLKDYARKLVLEAQQTGDAVSDLDSTVVYFENGVWSVTDNGECDATDDIDEAEVLVLQNLKSAME